MIQLLFDKVQVGPDDATPVLLLREAHGPRTLAIWISAVAGTAILTALEPSDDEHPNTHDLLVEALSVLDAVIENVRIVGVHEGVFTAELTLNGTTVACRVSDGVALALRCGAPLYTTEAVLTQAAHVHRGATDQASGADPEDEVEQFREFLDTISADDFEAEP